MYNTRVYAKCILSGEHTVLRGGQALLVPVTSRYLELDYLPGDSELIVNIESQHRAVELESVVHDLLGKFSKVEGGQVSFKSNIPVQAGLGASAALCVAMVRWFNYLGQVDEGNMFECARNLENTFHGQSSGADIAVALYGEPLVYQVDQPIQPLQVGRWPSLYLSYCGQKAGTMTQVQQVNDFFVTDRGQAETNDCKMEESVQLFQQGLALDDRGPQVKLLTEAMDLGRQCFQSWQLCPPVLQQHMEELHSHGAVAVKPTGSGGGGYVLSLWDEEPKPLPGLFPVIQRNT